MTLEDLFMDENKFPIYFVVKFPRMEIDRELNVIATDNEIKKKIGQPSKISKLCRDTLLIDVNSEEHGNKLSAIKLIAGNPAVVEPHRSMNQVKGTVYSETLPQSSVTEIMEKLSDQGVMKVEHMKHRVDCQLVDRHRYVLTFNRTKLPSLIKLAEWHKEIVDMYIPTPLRCTAKG